MTHSTEHQSQETTRKSYRVSAPTRQRILKEAARIFSNRGFEGTSLRSVAKAAGVDHSTLIHHFGDKTNLLREVLRARDIAYSPSGNALEKIKTPLTVGALTTGLMQAARMGLQDPENSQLFSVMSAEAGTEGHPAREYLQERHRILLPMFAEAITAQRGAGYLEDNGLSPDEEAARLIASWEGLEVFGRLHPTTVNVTRLLETTLRTGFGLTGDSQGAVIGGTPHGA